MKKSTFLTGAFIATASIVITKVLGIIYVIPFYALVGEQGGALYGYAYSIYSVFLSISSVGLPFAMSKIVSEYDALGYNYLKEKAYKIVRMLMIGTGFVSFIILFIFAPQISYLILGDITGGNTIEDVTFVVRVISTAILVVPLLSITRGYLQGHKFIKTSSIGTVLEQLVRVLVIIGGSFLAIKVFDLSLTTTVGIAVFAATLGAISAYIYLIERISKNKKELNRDSKITEPEKKITTKAIFKKVIIYALPFILIGVTRSIQNVIDMFTVVKTMVNSLNYTVTEAESVMSVLSTWGNKLNMIVTSIATGIALSLIPNISGDHAINNRKGISHKTNKALQILLFLTIPMTVGLSFLSVPVWNMFYSPSEVGYTVFKVSIFVALFSSLYTVVLSINQSLNRYKTVVISLLSSIMIKIILNIPLIILFEKMNLYPSYGATAATIISITTLILINLIDLNKKFNINFKETGINLLKILASTGGMILVMYIINLFISTKVYTKINSLIIVILFTITGGITYFLISKKFKLIDNLFGEELLEKIKRKFKRK